MSEASKKGSMRKLLTFVVLAGRHRIEDHYEDPSTVTFRDIEEDYWRLIKKSSQESVQVSFALPCYSLIPDFPPPLLAFVVRERSNMAMTYLRTSTGVGFFSDW